MQEPNEKGVAIRLGLESCAATARDPVKRRQRIGGVGIQLRHVQCHGLQLVHDPRTRLHQAVPIPQQLPQIAFLPSLPKR
jgi:hypothetical protein